MEEDELIPSLELGGMIVNRTSVDVQELAVLTLDRIRAMTDELFAAHDSLLPDMLSREVSPAARS